MFTPRQDFVQEEMSLCLFSVVGILLLLRTENVKGTPDATHTTDSTVECPDGITDVIDYGNLTEQGPGRVLQIRGDDFFVFGDKVFLSGITTDWTGRHQYFGNNLYEDSKKRLECYLRKVHSAGGNSVRIIVHGRTGNTLRFDQDGHVIGLDKEGTFINDIKKYLRAAAHYDILIFLTLWDTMAFPTGLEKVVSNEHGLQSYIDKALIPLVKAIKDEPGLGGYDIISLLRDQLIHPMTNAEPCFNTLAHNFGSMSARKTFTMEELLRFISRQADAIRSIDPSTPITAASEQKLFNTAHFVDFNFLKDECLLKAGGRPKYNASAFHLGKPLVIGPFVQGRLTTGEIFQNFYDHRYKGAFSCCAEHDSLFTNTLATQLNGLESIRYRTDTGGHVKFSLSKYLIVQHN